MGGWDGRLNDCVHSAERLIDTMTEFGCGPTPENADQRKTKSPSPQEVDVVDGIVFKMGRVTCEPCGLQAMIQWGCVGD